MLFNLPDHLLLKTSVSLFFIGASTALALVGVSNATWIPDSGNGHTAFRRDLMTAASEISEIPDTELNIAVSSRFTFV